MRLKSINHCKAVTLYLLIILLVMVNSAIASTIENNNAYRVCFTPGGQCTRLIVLAITHAKKSINVQAYSFTAKPIAKALIQAKQRGVKVIAILDKSNTHEKYSQMDALSQAGIPVYIDSKVRIAHNKVIILDGVATITGSFNFSWSAQHRNAENVLLIHNKKLSKRYTHNFYNRLKHSVRLMQYCFVTAHHHCRTTIVKTWNNVLPPAYLSVAKWKQCTATQHEGTWDGYCLPETRPASCPTRSWATLRKGHSIPRCRLKVGN